jgi:hypothetical protein
MLVGAVEHVGVDVTWVYWTTSKVLRGVPWVVVSSVRLFKLVPKPLPDGGCPGGPVGVRDLVGLNTSINVVGWCL